MYLSNLIPIARIVEKSQTAYNSKYLSNQTKRDTKRLNILSRIEQREKDYETLTNHFKSLVGKNIKIKQTTGIKFNPRTLL